VTELLFGLNLPTSAAPGADPVGDAVDAERLGYDFVSANDHPNGTSPTHEVWSLLTWIAAKTSRIKVATRVLGIPYRNPALVGKMASTLAGLSDGRLILGLGGGSSDEGIAAFGIEVPTPRMKIDGLEEAVRIVRGVWSEPGLTYEGAIYSTAGANVEPKPIEPIPIWLGTFGDRGLNLAGRVADGWIPSLEMAPPERARAMRERVLAAARQVGRDPEEITCVYNMGVRLDDRPDPNPSIVSGPPLQVIERLLEFANLGFTGMNFITVGPDPQEQRERLAREVLPHVRSAGTNR
jgi:alkanesulfonate monooxygenase SsuD/methylene tetrahydromethanopterin reductase-like flavin-dependent oxidoreductase (luciferase family)